MPEIAFVTDAPRKDGSNAVFRRALQTAGVSHDTYPVLEVFNFPLPDDEVKNVCAPTREAREWPGYDLPPIGKASYLRPEYLPQLDRLEKELARVAPVVIVPLGPTALWALTGLSNIGACRGALLPATRLAPGVKLVPSLHPSQVMADFRMFHVMVSDVEKAVREASHADIRLPRRELWLEPTLSDMQHFKAKWIDGADLLSVDIETGWKQITCIGFAPNSHRSIVVPFWDFRRPHRSYWPSVDAELAAWEWVAAVCEGPVPKLLQNGPYDIYWLWDRYGIKVRNYRQDTRLMHHALYPELPKSLEFMGGCYATQGPWKLLSPRHAGSGEEKRDA